MDWDARLYKFNATAGVWQRVTLPTNVMTQVQFEVLEKGGWGNGKVTLVAPWQTYNLTGTERLDIYWQGQLRYRGLVRLPEAQMKQPESKVLNLVGAIASLNSDYQVRRRYAYVSYVDLSRVATDLVNDLCINSGRYPNLTTDFETVGVQVQSFDATGKSLAEAFNQLLDVSPDSAYWGFDVGSGSPAPDRIYLRPRTLTPKYTVVAGKDFSSLQYPMDTTAIVNRVYIKGGKALQPNLLYNGGFEYPSPPDETHGNLLGDYSFEWSLEQKSTAWSFISSASVKTDSDTGGGLPGGYVGSAWASLDHNGEGIQQAVPVDYTKVLVGCCWIRRGNPTTAATCNVFVDGLNASGTVVTTVQAYTSATDPGTLVGPLGVVDPNSYVQAKVTADFTLFPTVTQARFRVLSYNGTGNNDGVFVDVCALYYRDLVAQAGWTQTLGPGSGAINWVQQPVDSSIDNRGYVIYVPPVTSGYTEVRTAEWSRAKAAMNKQYNVLVMARTTPGSGSNFSLTLGVNTWNSDGTENSVLESATFTGGSDNAWHVLAFPFASGSADVDVEVFVRIHGSIGVYLDNAMMVEGPAPLEMLQDYNWWEGADYERTYDVTSADLGLTGAAASSITTYGLREASESQSQVTDKTTAIAFAQGYLAANAVPKHPTKLELDEYSGWIGVDGAVRVVNVPNAPPTLYCSRVQYTIDSSVKVELELGEERPTLAGLLRAVQTEKTGQLAGVAGATGGGSAGSSPYNAGGSTGSGAVTNTANLVDLTSAQTISGAKTFTGQIAIPTSAGNPAFTPSQPAICYDTTHHKLWVYNTATADWDFVSLTALPPPSALLTGLVSYWTLDEASGIRYDSSGSNDLTSNNSVGTAAGKLGQAASFVAASTQYLSAANPGLQMGPGQQFTVCCWVNLDSSTQLFLSTANAGGTGGYLLSMQTYWTLYVNGSAVLGPAWTSGWHFICAGWDGTNAWLQVDNGTVATAAAAGPTLTSQPFSLGAYNFGSYPANGLIDGVGVWSRTLTSTERTALYNGGAGKDYPFS